MLVAAHPRFGAAGICSTRFASCGVGPEDTMAVFGFTLFNRGGSAGTEVLDQGRAALLPPDPERAFTLAGAERHLGRLELIDVTGQPFRSAMRVITRTTPAADANLQLTAPTVAYVHAGDTLLARFWIRCEDSMTGEAFTTFVFGPAGGDAPVAAEFRVGAADRWIEVFVPFRATRDFPAGHASVCFRAGFDRQTIDIAGIQVINYGTAVDVSDLPKTTITYRGREASAAWREQALRRIEQIRKGELTVHVIDAAGKPLADAQVQIRQRRHAFGFGSAITMQHLLDDTPDAQRYREIVETYFNTAVFENDMKWPANYPAIDPRVDDALDWLLERQIRVRGHNLIWPSWKWLPKPLREYAHNPDELRRKTCQRVTDAVSHYRGRIVHWDVVNEPYSEHDLMDILGRDVMVEWFKLAKHADPQCQMYLNDFGIFDGQALSAHREHFHDTIKYLIDRGAPIDGIGIQSHFGSSLPAPTQLLAVLDRFAEFGRPIESTEVSFNLDDRELQAEYMSDYLIALFSHPQVTGIMLWGFWEGRHWRPQAALFDRHWSPRPIARAWINLVHKQWKTNAELRTDTAGTAKTRGFCGEHVITVTANGMTKTASAQLDRHGANVTVEFD